MALKQFTRSIEIWVGMRHPKFLFLLIVMLQCLKASSFSQASSQNQLKGISDGKDKWSPKIQNLEDRIKLRGLEHNSELIGSLGFHHVELYCGDAKSTAFRFSLALGMPICFVSDLSTGNDQCCSYGLQSNDLRFLFTAPYSKEMANQATTKHSSLNTSSEEGQKDYEAPNPLPSFSVNGSHIFFQRHGVAVRAVAIEVKNVRQAFDAAIKNGANSALSPTEIPACAGFCERHHLNSEDVKCEIAEVELYGDVVLRFISFESESSLESCDSDIPYPFLPNLSYYPPILKRKRLQTYGLQRIDHAVGNVPDLFQAHKRISGFTGFHEFAEFTSTDVGTVDSGLNSVVLASDSENVLLPLNEPTVGRRKSQIQTFLEQNEGPGLQHLALKTNDIFKTVSKMKHAEEELGGFDLMNRPSDDYYRELPERLGDLLTAEQYLKLEEYGILADADDEGVLLQIFTKPVGDRPTLFFEIIQRIGCVTERENKSSDHVVQRPGCGGFGQGNFKELFKSIEDYEKTLKV